MTRSLSLLLALTACAPTPVEPVTPVVNDPIAPQSSDDLGWVLSVARACMMHEAPAISLMPHESVTAAGDGLWQVRIRDQDTVAHTSIVDVARGSCGDVRVKTERGPALGSLAVLMDRAWQCGQELGGMGVGDTPLVQQGMVLHSNHGENRTFSISETEVRSIPTGLDLVAGTTCGRLEMD